MKKGPYIKLIVIMAISFVIMYSVMFLNVDKASDIYLSLTRTYMALLMVSPMSVLMILLMQKMYMDRRMNIITCLTGIVVFVVSLILLRTQTPVGDQQYMMAMIPHHSSAILTSKHATIRDPELKRLSESIIQSQEREIIEMKKILERLDSTAKQ